MRFPAHLITAVGGVLLAVACAAEPKPDAPRPAAPAGSAPDGRLASAGGLPGSEWVLVSLGGARPSPRPPLTLVFEDTTFGGYGGCNWMGGRYAAGSGTLRTWDLSSTARGCDEARMSQEARFDRALRDVRRFRLAADTLRLLGAEGDRVLLELHRRRFAEMDPARLVGTRWRLVSSGDRAPPAGRRITLAFSGDSIRGHAGCRDYVGTYHARGHRFGTTSIRMLQLECPDPRRLREEGDFTTALSESGHFQLQGGALLLYPVSGEVLRFEREEGSGALIEKS